MKQRVLAIILFLIPFYLFAQKISVSNILGCDKTENSSDVFSFVKNTSDEFVFCENPFFSDRFQIDSKSQRIESRCRFDLNFLKSKDAVVDFSIKGYGMFFPLPYLGIGVGNSFFQKYVLKGAWLGACDDSPKPGRFLKNGLGLYVNVPVWKFGDLRSSFSLTPESWSENDSSGIGSRVFYNAAFEYEVPGVASIGAVFQNIKDAFFRYGIFSSLMFLDGFYLNAGFVYNFRDSDFLPFRIDSKSESDSFNTKYALISSIGYENSVYNFGVFADFISGTGNSYIKKSGKTGVYNDNEIPFFTALRLNYKTSENLIFEIRNNLSFMFPAMTYVHWELYGSGEYKISKNAGYIKTGIRIDFSGSRLTGFSFPVVWKVKISEK